MQASKAEGYGLGLALLAVLGSQKRKGKMLQPLLTCKRGNKEVEIICPNKF